MSLDELLEAGHKALAEGDWSAAARAFEEATGRGGDAVAFEGLGLAAWWTDDDAVLFPAWDEAYRRYRGAGDALGAARVASALANASVLFRGEWAVAQGWYRRAHRLIDDLPPAPEHVRLRIFEGNMELVITQDPARAAELGREAATLARAQGSAGLELESIALEGVALVRLGAVSEGMRLLDESTAGALAGEIDGLEAVWLTCCFLLWGCEYARDFDRAAQWCDRLMEFTQRMQMVYAFSVCRAHYGSVLTWKGAWADAERELARAGQTMQQGRPPSVGEAWARLGELRRRQGRYDEARELFEQSPFTLLARIGMVELLLDEGDAPAALEAGTRLLASLRADDAVPRSAVLEVVVRAAAACDRVSEGMQWLDELDACSAQVGTDPARAGAARARGVTQLANGDADDAAAALGTAVALYDRSGGVFEASRTRLDLARALDAIGDTARGERERGEAARCLHELGAGELTPRAATGESLLTEREQEVMRLVADGMSNKAIATRLHLSEHTVKRHVANILTKTGLPTRAAVAAYAARLGI